MVMVVKIVARAEAIGAVRERKTVGTGLCAYSGYGEHGGECRCVRLGSLSQIAAHGVDNLGILSAELLGSPYQKGHVGVVF